MPVFNQIPTAELQVDNVVQTVVSVGGVSAVLLPANPERKFLRIKHQSSGGAAFVYVKFAAAAATATNALELSEGAIHLEGVGTGEMIYTGEIRAISSGGARPVYVEERF